jgi:hypothetical protein
MWKIMVSEHSRPKNWWLYLKTNLKQERLEHLPKKNKVLSWKLSPIKKFKKMKTNLFLKLFLVISHLQTFFFSLIKSEKWKTKCGSIKAFVQISSTHIRLHIILRSEKSKGSWVIRMTKLSLKPRFPGVSSSLPVITVIPAKGCEYISRS